MIPLGVLGAAHVPASGGGPLTVEYVTAVNNSSDLASYTFTDVAIGTAAADRTVVIALHWRNASGRTISTFTIGGTPVTVDVSRLAAIDRVVIGRVAIPSGTTATVAVTFSGGVVSCSIGVFRVTGGTLAVFDTAMGGDAITVDAAAGGVVVGAGTSSQQPRVFGTTDVPADYWLNPDGTRSAGGGAVDTPSAATLDVAMEATTSALAAVAYEPA